MSKVKGQRSKVVVAMSGGIDSSVAAVLLKRANFNVVGVFMRFGPQSGPTRKNADNNAELRGNENRCCTSEAEARARRVAKILNIPFYVFDFSKEFKKKIVDYFLKEHKAGRTPNPCVVCNKEIKFGLLLEKALELGADYIATGHYARKREVKSLPLRGISRREKKSKVSPYGGSPEGRKSQNSKLIYKLFQAKDKEKDQSYFLWQLKQKQLKRILFPIGDYTKTQVRALAKKFKLPVLNIPESMEVCFINTNIHEFLKTRINPHTKTFGVGVNTNKGKIVDNRGKVIGEHQGLWFYTIGQRKGLGLVGGPWYVVEKDIKRNRLVIGEEKDLYKKELICKNVNWVSPKQSLRDATGQADKVPKLPLKVQAKIRYRSEPASAKITRIYADKADLCGLIKVIFDKSQRAITPGQSVVFYRNSELLGGGIII